MRAVRVALLWLTATSLCACAGGNTVASPVATAPPIMRQPETIVFRQGDFDLLQAVAGDGATDRISLLLGGGPDPAYALETRRLSDGSKVARFDGSCSINPSLEGVPEARAVVIVCDEDDRSLDLTSFDEVKGRALAHRRLPFGHTDTLGKSLLFEFPHFASAQLLDARTLQPTGPVLRGSVMPLDDERAVIIGRGGASVLDGKGDLAPVPKSIASLMNGSRQVLFYPPGRIGVMIDDQHFRYFDQTGKELGTIRLDSDETQAQADPSSGWLNFEIVKLSGPGHGSVSYLRYDPEGNAAGRVTERADYCSRASQPAQFVSVENRTYFICGTNVGLIDWSDGSVGAPLPTPSYIDGGNETYAIPNSTAVFMYLNDQVNTVLVESVDADATTPVKIVKLEAVSARTR